MVRVLLAHPSDELYGADRVLLEVARALRTSHRISVALPDDLEFPRRQLSRALSSMGVEFSIETLPVLRRANMTAVGLLQLLRRAWRGARSLRRVDAELVYVNTAALLPLAWLVPRRTAVLVHLHEDLRGIEGVLLNVLLRRADMILCVSTAVEGRLSERNRSSSRVVHNGFSGLGGPYKHPGDSNSIRILMASRWNAWKGHEVLLRAWGQLTRKDLRLTLLGGPPLSGATVDVRRLVAGLPDPKSVELVGEVGSTDPYLRDVDLVVVPSTSPDPLPTIAIEALAAGVPVMASRSGGLPEIVTEGVNGFLVTPGDHDAWAKALEALDSDALLAMREAARASFEVRFAAQSFRQAVALAVRDALDVKQSSNRGGARAP